MNQTPPFLTQDQQEDDSIITEAVQRNGRSDNEWLTKYFENDGEDGREDTEDNNQLDELHTDDNSTDGTEESYSSRESISSNAEGGAFKNLRIFKNCRKRFQKCRTFLCVALFSVFFLTFIWSCLLSFVPFIQKAFRLHPVEASILASLWEMGSSATVIVLCYFGGRPNSNKPRWISSSLFLASIGCILIFLAYQIQILNHIPNETDICPQAKNSSFLSDNDLVCKKFDKLLFNGFADIITPSYLLIICGALCLGVGSVPPAVLSLLYIDENVSPQTWPLYIVILLVGFGFGKLFAGAVVTFINYNPSNFEKGSCLIFLLTGVFLALLSLIFLLFPKSLWIQWYPGQDRQQQSDKPLSEFSRRKSRVRHFLTKGKDLFKRIARMFRNQVFIFVTIGLCLEVSFGSGFLTFMPIFLQINFGFYNTNAEIASVVAPWTSFIFGCIIISVLFKHIEFNAERTAKLLSIITFISTVILGLSVFSKCHESYISGIDIQYGNRSTLINKQPQLVSRCNDNCDCSVENYAPVCGGDGLTYFSPCHAGCSNIVHSTYENCTCISSSLENTTNKSQMEMKIDMTSKRGACGSEKCYGMITAFFVTFCITFMLIGMETICCFLVVIRNVTETQKAISFASQFLVIYILGYLASQIYYNKLLDLSCLLRKDEKCHYQSSCTFYEISMFRTYYYLISVVIKLVAFISFFIAWLKTISWKESIKLNHTIDYSQQWSNRRQFRAQLEMVETNENSQPYNNEFDEYPENRKQNITSQGMQDSTDDLSNNQSGLRVSYV